MNQKVIAGVDEAGRGPLAGPVVASAVILDPAKIPEGLRDSKKLSEKKREALALDIHQHAQAVAVGIIHEQDIDRSNILKATFKAMKQAVDHLPVKPQKVIIDGKFTIPNLYLAQQAIIGGDDSEPAISAASIIAKTTRDAMMRSYHILFPEYGFISHKGYGSRKHMEALHERGRCPIHRRSFHPVMNARNEHYTYFREENNYGRMGEIIAGMYLIRQGWTLLNHGFRAGNRGEIDLIARRGGITAFLEVKSFAGTSDEEALSRVTPAKQKQIARVAEIYVQQQQDQDASYRFDIMTINFRNKKPDIQHYEEAFLPL